MVHSIDRIANNSAINSQHLVHLEKMAKLIAKEVSKNRLAIDVAFIRLNVQRYILLTYLHT